MKKEIFKSYEELPLMLSVPEMAAALGISRAGAYELARSEGFPALRIGTRIVIPKDKLQEWVDKQTEKITGVYPSDLIKSPISFRTCFKS